MSFLAIIDFFYISDNLRSSINLHKIGRLLGMRMIPRQEMAHIIITTNHLAFNIFCES